MAYQIVKFKRGNKINLPDEGIDGQPYFTNDTGELYIGRGEGKGLKKIAPQQKIITFVCKNGREGAFGPCIKFPYKGKIVGVNATCSVPGDLASVLNIIKISESDYKNELDSWEEVLDEGLTIPANKKFSIDNYVIKNANVNANDYFRLSMLFYNDIIDIVVEIIIDLEDI